ncbi:hypothetical protein K458DRAFT_125172 [Lentithecium fluviatile CBS 122367]|uniref:Uncharacterized protein n=1 Tax=Lentithecium fluviatile CBS 122367 TaxID=1168545 RepID=A0A6G1JGA5_9PLEO|nr:hypothetical protein K458DRAFT_125172 [Lentithecium fluviatile CBS 122367]
MAHQAHALPWQTIADHFKFVYKNRKYNDRTNLYPCFKPGQGKQLQHFARVFARVMGHASAQERKNYPDELIPPEDDEIFIPDSSLKRIAKTVKYYKTLRQKNIISDDERKLPCWMECFDALRLSWPTCGVRDTMELFKTLILYGEMEPLLRLATHAHVRLPDLYSYPLGGGIEDGYTDVKNSALIAYICLNMFFIKPELHDPTSRAHKLDEMKQKFGLSYTEQMFDYRNTSSYQKLLTHCTHTGWGTEWGVCALPHREFFGIDRHMITTPYWSDLAKSRIGTGRVSQLFNAPYRFWYVPTASDVSAALAILTTRVPTELALQILEHADYTAKRRIQVAHDPLHADNVEELKKYLGYCWKVLVRVDMLVKASGHWIDWQYEVTEVIYDLWGVSYPKMSTTVDDIWYKGRKEGEVDRARNRRTFI